jgi:hypothetical protein
MIETLIFGLGVAVGAGGLYALYALYQWIARLKNRVESLKWELHHHTINRELWTEFSHWKREEQSKSK